MKKLIYLIMVIAVLGLIVTGCIPMVPPSEQNEPELLPNKNMYDVYPGDSIQDAIDAAISGDIILVAPGTYDLKASIRVYKPVSIIGDINNPENVVINAGTIPANSGPKPPDRDRDAFQVAADNVVIKGFNIINALYLMTGSGDGWQNAGIAVGGDITIIDWLVPYNEPLLIDGGTFSNNIIEDCSIGIYLAMSKNIIVSDNLIRNSTVGSGDSYNVNAGVGIMNWNTKAWGIFWQDPINNIIERNVVEYSDRQGICLGAWLDIFTVSGTVIRDNTIRYSGQWGSNPGIDLMYVTGPLDITGNDIYSNPTGIGIGPEVTGIEAHFNNINDNTNFGAKVWDWTGTALLDATRNWWGSPTGPNRELPNGKWVGKGDKVSSNIDYKPWSPHPVEFCNNLSLNCTTIQDGILLTSDGRVITTGYDEWGYDYQAHMFNGYYCDAYRDAGWCQEWKDVRLMMCWNDAWLSNMDCDADGLLDRHYGYESYIGSGAWLTNHQSGEYAGGDGEICKWNYFVKIVAAPSDAYVDSGYWYTADGTEIGPVIWGAFAIIQRVENDPCAGISGLQYSSPCGPGLGKWEGEF